MACGNLEEMETNNFHDALLREFADTGQIFPVHSESVSILETPTHFFHALKDGISHARNRVVMASLYIGTGALEHQLLDCVAKALADNPSLQVTMLFDALRSTRPTTESSTFASSAHMLQQLLLADGAMWRQPPDPSEAAGGNNRLNVSLYHTPDLAGAVKSVLPARFNEGMGVFHIKAYVFDETVLISGANLSTSYFTDRQDRYMLFSDCKQLADWTCRLIHVLASFSYTLDGTGQLLLPPSLIDPVRAPSLFRARMAQAVRQEMKLGLATTSGRNDACAAWMERSDTWVYPTLQMGPVGILQDEACLLWLLNQLPAGSYIHLASAYFNLTPELESALSKAAAGSKDLYILTASPQANGFYGSAGISRFIPHVYSLYEQQFHTRCQRAATQGKVRIQEYRRQGWTFHAKGAWCSLPGQAASPSVTVIGSSNFGHRSRHRDLEAQLFMITKDHRLQQRLRQERDSLYSGAEIVHTGTFSRPDRTSSPFIRAAARFVRNWL